MSGSFELDVCVVGGGGHVGLPLALTFADCGLRTAIYDTNAATVASLAEGRMPFQEEGAADVLARTLASGDLVVGTDPGIARRAEFIVTVVGTPIDEHLQPDFSQVIVALDDCRPHMRAGQVVILRSTVFPGMSGFVRRHLVDAGLDVGVAFCPERVAQGQSMREFRDLPQIVSAFDDRTLARVSALFGRFACELIELSPMEAELAKLMTNAWRYIQFATVNQFYMLATEHGLDFDRILHGCRHNYPRMNAMPGPGFSAGPCLRKDTMQLASFCENRFLIGHAAMLVNEGLPAHVISLAKRDGDLAGCTVGILGMAFKAGSDDKRDSLSYKLRNLLRLEAREVLCTDPHVPDPSLVDLDVVLERADVLFVGAPHAEYRELRVPPNVRAYDVWSMLPRGDATPA